MKSKIIRFFLITAIAINLINCAKKGSPTGGEKDITPPSVVKSNPEPLTINFKTEKIRISFDEYIKLNDLQKQLIVSPPLKYLPEIKPQGTAAKYMEIEIKDTLQENTTYVLNFGQSIVDNNEGNPYSFYKYIFSTGDYIDSLTLNGHVVDAVEKKPDEFISIMLYEIDSTYKDSIIYQKTPTYITNTLDSATTFQLTNLKAGKYMLIGMKDVSNNYLFNQKTDKIAFISDFVEIPTDSTYQLTLFKEVNNFRAAQPSLIAKNRIIFGYEGNYKDMEIELLSDTPEDYKYHITKNRETDSLNYWFTPFETDSLIFTVGTLKTIDTFTVRMKELYNDTLELKQDRGKPFGIGEMFKINASTPIVKINTDSITIINKDSIPQEFISILDTINNQLSLKWETTAKERYKISIKESAFEDFFGHVNDTLIEYGATTKGLADLGSIRVKLNNVESYPIIVQLTNNQGEVLHEVYSEKATPFYDFININPSNYLLRVIFDANKNGEWDTGSYLQKTQPERISYYPSEIELKPNWELEQEFTLE